MRHQLLLIPALVAIEVAQCVGLCSPSGDYVQGSCEAHATRSSSSQPLECWQMLSSRFRWRRSWNAVGAWRSAALRCRRASLPVVAQRALCAQIQCTRIQALRHLAGGDAVVESRAPIRMVARARNRELCSKERWARCSQITDDVVGSSPGCGHLGEHTQRRHALGASLASKEVP